MAWLAIAKDGTEYVTAQKPEYLISLDLWWTENDQIELPSGSIRKMLGKEITVSESPVEI